MKTVESEVITFTFDCPANLADQGFRRLCQDDSIPSSLKGKIITAVHEIVGSFTWAGYQASGGQWADDNSQMVTVVADGTEIHLLFQVALRESNEWKFNSIEYNSSIFDQLLEGSYDIQHLLEAKYS